MENACLRYIADFGCSFAFRREFAARGQMTLQQTIAETSTNLEHRACPLCDSDRRELPFRLHRPYRMARCTECGLHYLYPWLVESAMQEADRQGSRYEGGACGYADTGYVAQEPALRATFKCLLRNLAKRGLTGAIFWTSGCGSSRQGRGQPSFGRLERRSSKEITTCLTKRKSW